ncbi:MAG: FAD:protein FMN transferase [Myxococcaceae bacterium]
MGSEGDESFAEIVVDPGVGSTPSPSPSPSPGPERGEFVLTLGKGEKVDPEREKRLFERVKERFDWAKANLSPVDTAPVTSINQRAAVHGVVTPPEVCAPIREALVIAEKTGGAFDPTFTGGSCDRVDFRKVEVRDTPFAVKHPPCTVRFTEAGMRLDLETFARAWALDRAAQLLREEGLTHFLLRVGSLGVAAGTWEVPLPEGAPAKVISITDRAFAGAMDPDTRIVDPGNCRPVPGNRAALILAPTATESLGFSRAAVTREPSAAVKWLTSQGASGVVRQGEGVVSTEDLRPILWPPPPPDAGFRFP